MVLLRSVAWKEDKMGNECEARYKKYQIYSYVCFLLERAWCGINIIPPVYSVTIVV